MLTMVHPNGCVHEVRDDLVAKFVAAGWEEIKAAPDGSADHPNETIPPENPEETKEPEEKPKGGRTRNKK